MNIPFSEWAPLYAASLDKSLFSPGPERSEGPERREINTPPPAKELLMSEPTLTVEQLNAILAAINTPPSGRGRKRKGNGFKKSTPEEAELRRKANDEECVRKFTAQGHKDVKPRINVLTFGKWVEKGRQVRKGEKGTQVGPFNLFHESQTDPITATPAASVGTVTPAPASAVSAAPKAEVKAVETKAAKSDWTEWNS